MAMAKPLVTEELWEAIGPLLPKHEPSPRGGRPRVPDRACLAGIVFVLKTGIPWEDLPAEMGCGSGMTCWRRLEEWRRAGVWESLHAAALAKLRGADEIDWSRAAVDSSRVKAPLGGKKPARTRPTGPSPAASTRWWSTPAASRSRPCSPGRTATT
jgi:transposase